MLAKVIERLKSSTKLAGWRRTIIDHLNNMIWRQQRRWIPHSLLSNKERSNDPSYPNLAVAAIAIGKKYLSWSLAMIETLRKNGEFNGPVYIFTDQPQFYVTCDNVITVKVPFTHNRMLVKQYKTMLFDWIPYERILYLDVDVMVGGLLSPWLDEVEIGIKNHAILMFDHASTGRRSFSKYHTGIMLLNRPLALLLLNRWRKALQSGQYRSDQLAFSEIVNPDEVYLMPSRHLLFPTAETVKSGRTSTFIHITLYRQRIIKPDVLGDYLRDVLNVTQVPIQCGMRCGEER